MLSIRRSRLRPTFMRCCGHKFLAGLVSRVRGQQRRYYFRLLGHSVSSRNLPDSAQLAAYGPGPGSPAGRDAVLQRYHSERLQTGARACSASSQIRRTGEQEEGYSLLRRGETVQESILKLLRAKSGHFLLESSHHGDLWLDLETLCLRPRLLEPLIKELAKRLATMEIEAVCGPLVEGAFAALMVAGQLDIEFTYSERFSQPTPDGLFPVAYRVPTPLRERLRGKRVAIVNDVINAGSAAMGTFTDLQQCGANLVAIGALLVLGTPASEFAARANIALISLATLPNNLWTARACPLCAAGVALEDAGGFADALPPEPADRLDS